MLNDSEPLCELCKALEEADVNISLDWSGYSSKEDAVDPMIVDAVDHTQVNYLDPDMSLKADIVTGNGFKSIFFPLQEAWKCICIHPIQLIPCSAHIPWVDSGRAIAAPDS